MAKPKAKSSPKPASKKVARRASEVKRPRPAAPKPEKRARPPAGVPKPPHAEAAPESADVLVLISQRRFARARSLIAPSAEAALALADVAAVFNYATATWGDEGAPPLALFKRAFELASQSQSEEGNAESANFHQCFALIAAVVGKRSIAQAEVEKSRRLCPPFGGKPEFSGWRYRDARRTEFLKDLDALGRLIDDPSVVPAFVAAGRDAS